jgi:hypothetical protein
MVAQRVACIGRTHPPSDLIHSQHIPAGTILALQHRCKGDYAMQELRIATDWIGLDPFSYLVVTLLASVLWTYCTTVSDFSLSGPGVWVRRSALLLASLGIILFAYTVHTLA